MDDFNPYTAPATPIVSVPIPDSADVGRGVWHDGDTLVMVKIAQLPHRCVKCNATATYLLKRSLAWHTPALYFMIVFPGLIFYIIVALIVRKTATIMVPLCEEHRARRSKGILIAWLAALGGFALFFVPAVSGNFTSALNDSIPIFILLGIVMILFGLIFGMIRSQPVTPKKIDKTHVWLNKVCPEYLASLPPVPGFGSSDK